MVPAMGEAKRQGTGAQCEEVGASGDNIYTVNHKQMRADSADTAGLHHVG